MHLIRLANKRLKSQQAYLEFQNFQGELLVKYLKTQGTLSPEAAVLDLGCGYGGYSDALLCSGAKTTSIDLSVPATAKSLKFARADALHLPFGKEAFDLVICASLIEHVPEPADLVKEIERVLTTRGFAYISFPPFYSPIGGHQFSPFHLFGEKIAIRAYHMRGNYRGNAWLSEEFGHSPGSFEKAWGSWGLYPLTIRRVLALIKACNFDVVDQSTRWMSINTSKLPLLGDFLTWHVQFLLQKNKRISIG